MNKQRGITFLGFIIVTAIVLSILLAGMKIIPAYVEHATVKKVIHGFGDKTELSSMTNKDIIESFNKSAGTNYITVVTGQDLIISEGLSGPIVSVEYQVVEPLVANLSALMDFKASTED